jgi:hypothetical protein
MDVDALRAEAILGKDAEEFISSELGRYIIGRVDQEREEAVQQLCKTWSWRRNRIRELQNQIWRCDTFKSWLADMVVRGKSAIDLLEQDS